MTANTLDAQKVFRLLGHCYGVFAHFAAPNDPWTISDASYKYTARLGIYQAERRAGGETTTVFVLGRLLVSIWRL